MVNQKWEELKVYANLVICRGHEEPYEARVSRTVLGEPEGEVPSGDSTDDQPSALLPGLILHVALYFIMRFSVILQVAAVYCEIDST